MTRREYFQKLAYDLGRQAAIKEMEKQAGLGTGLKAAWGLGKNLWSSTFKGLTSGLGTLGRTAIKPIQGVSPGTHKWLTTAGKGVASDMVGFGLLGGGINAALADPGERLKAFGTGAVGGALSGAAWRGTSNVLAAGQKSLYRGLHGNKLTPYGPGKGLYGRAQGTVFKPVESVSRQAKAHVKAEKSWFTNPERWYNRFNQGAVGRIGAKAAIGTVPLAGALYASSLTPSFEGDGATMGAAPPANPPQYGQQYAQQQQWR